MVPPGSNSNATRAPARAHAASQHGSHEPTDNAAAIFSQAAGLLTSWYHEHARDLPWRRTSDPYAILVSELMLQQTRVETVAPRFEKFLERFPDFEALATATAEEVLAAWSGLGYYRRARALHTLAQIVVGEHGGRLPDDRQTLLTLPGIGPYTAAAVSSIAFGTARLSIDGNVARVARRLLDLDEDPRAGAARRRLEEAANDALARLPPGTLNQALMELGATVCLPRTPHCHRCPCGEICVARANGRERHPSPIKRQAVYDVVEASVVIEQGGKLLLFRGQRPGVLQEMWEFPTLDSRLADSSADHEQPGTDSSDCLLRQLRLHLRSLGWELVGTEHLGQIRHGITNRRIRCEVYRARLERSTQRSTIGWPQASAELGPSAHRWLPLRQIASLPLAASARKTLKLLSPS